MAAVDETLPQQLRDTLTQACVVLSVVVVISTVFPAMLLVFVLLGVIYLRLRDRYLRATREVKRLDSISRSPIYSNFEVGACMPLVPPHERLPSPSLLQTHSHPLS